MPVEPTEIAALGFQLAARADSEVVMRAAVGRIYYGLFLMSRELFNVTNRRREAHDVVAQAIGKATKRATREKYDELRGLREEADYQPETDGWDDRLIRAQRLYRQVVQDLKDREKLPPTFLVPSISRGIGTG